MKSLIAAAMAAALAGCAGSHVAPPAAPAAPVKYLVNPGNTQRVYEAWHYAQAARVGDTIWVSGQVGARSEPTSIEAQAELVFERLKSTLEAAGASLADVVELTSYHLNMADFSKVAAVKDRFMPNHYPAWTAVGTTGLVMPQALLEIKAVAVVGSGKQVQVVAQMPDASAPAAVP